MFESILHLIGPFWEIVLVIGSGLAVLAGTYLKGLSHGKSGEQNKQFMREQATRNEDDKTIKKARIARRNVDPDGMRNDPNNRDNRG